MASREHPIERRAARVVLLDPTDRVLLFASAMPDRRPGTLWVPPGGALEAGEDWATAAARELREETGFVLPLGPCVWIREHLWYWGDRGSWVLAIEHFFVARTETTEISTTGWTDGEREATKGWRWWSVEELARTTTTTDTIVPRPLAELVPDLAAGRFPVAPLVIGE